MKIKLNNPNLGLPMDQEFEVKRTHEIYIIDAGDPIGEIMVSHEDVIVVDDSEHR